MGFSKNWNRCFSMVSVVLFPYFTVTGTWSEGTLSVRYSPVLQVIFSPNCSLLRQGHNSVLAGGEGSHKVTMQWRPTWQQPDSLLSSGFADSLARYFSVTSA